MFLFWLVYKDQDFNKLLDSLKDVNYWWIALSIFFGILSHLSRAARWRMLARSLDYKPKFYNSFFAVMAGYLVNLAVPRLGEVSRAALINRYEKIPFSQSFGTIVAERVIDLLILFLLTVAILLTNFDVILQFFQNNPTVGDKFKNISVPVNFIIIACAGIVTIIFLFILFRKKIRNHPVYQKIAGFFKNFVEGFKSLGKIKRLPVFIFHSLFIWFMYFLMLYVSFFAFSFTDHLGLNAALVVFVMGSFGMVAPVQGGIGAWHFMAIGTLIIFGIQQDSAGIFALIVHSVQTLMLLVFGFLSFVALPIVNKVK